MMKKCSTVLVTGFMAAMLLSASSQGKPSDLNEIVIAQAERVMDVGSYEKGDIYVDSIRYGSFSRPEEAEMLVQCKFRDNPHVAGLDRTLAMVFSCETQEMIACRLFSADEVILRLIPEEKGVSKILFSGRTISQGIVTQYADCFCIRNHEWQKIPLEEAESDQSAL